MINIMKKTLVRFYYNLISIIFSLIVLSVFGLLSARVVKASCWIDQYLSSCSDNPQEGAWCEYNEYLLCGGAYGWGNVANCEYSGCASGMLYESIKWCCSNANETPPCHLCGDGCFSGETKIGTSGGTDEIKSLTVGDKITSQNAETGENTTSLVEKIYEVTRSAYYKLTLKNGKEVKVTGEHPLYAIAQGQQPLSFIDYLKTQSLTKRALDYIVNKFRQLSI